MKRDELTNEDRENFRNEFRQMFRMAQGHGQVAIRIELLGDLEAEIPPGTELYRILDPFDKPGWVRFQWGM